MKAPSARRTAVRLLRDRSASSAAEYALILAIVGVAVAIAVANVNGEDRRAPLTAGASPAQTISGS